MGIHLVPLPVAEGGGGAGRRPEGAVERGGVLGGVGHDGGGLIAVLVQDGPNGGYPAVHHVGGGHHVRPRLHMGEGGLGQHLQGLVVVHALAAEDAAVAVVGILAHAHVGDHIEIRVFGLDGPDGLLHHAVLCPGGGAHGVLLTGQAEEDAVGHPGGQAVGHRLAHRVQAVVELAGQGLDGPLTAEGLVHEDGVDQAVGGQAGLPAQAAHRVASPQAAGALNEFHICASFLNPAGR